MYHIQDRSKEEAIRQAFKSGKAQDLKLIFSEETLSAKNGDIEAGGMDLTEYFCTSEDIRCGETPSATVTVSLINRSGSLDDFAYGEFEMQVGVKVNEGYEYVPLGIYYAEKPEKVKDEIITISEARDRMRFFDIDAAPFLAGIAYPIYLGNLAQALYDYVGVTPAVQETVGSGYRITYNPFPTVCSCRDILHWIAEARHKNARFNRNGELEYYWIGESSVETITEGDIQDGSLQTAEYSTEAVDMFVNKNMAGLSYITKDPGSSENAYYVLGNPFIQEGLAADYISVLRGIPVFRPVSASLIDADPFIECGDLVTVIDQVIPIMMRTVKFAGYFSAEYTASGNRRREEEDQTDYSMNVSNSADGVIEKVKAKGIDASEINVTNLNASEIKSGTLSADRIAASSITVQKLVSGNLDNLCTIDPNNTKTWRTNTVDAGYDDEGNKAIKTSGSQLYLTSAASRWNIAVGDTIYVKARLYAASNVDVNVRIQSHKVGIDDIIGRLNQRFSLTAGWNNIEANITIDEAFLADDCVRFNIGIIPFNASVEIRASSFYAQIARSGKLIVDGTIKTEKLAANAVTAEKIAANAVTAGKIAANAVTADKIQAGAITANKIAIGNYENMIDISPDDSATWPDSIVSGGADNNGNAAIQKATASATTFPLNAFNRAFNLAAGEKVYIKANIWTQAAQAYPNIDIRLSCYDTNGTFMWQEHSGVALNAGWNEIETAVNVRNPLPDGSARYLLSIYQQPGAATQLKVSMPFAQVKRSGELIVDGTIKASKIKADEVLTQHLTAQDLDITGGSVDIETESTSDSRIKLRGGSYETGMKATGVSAKQISGSTVTSEADVDANTGIRLSRSNGFEAGINLNVIGGSSTIGGTASLSIPPSLYAKDGSGHTSYVSPTEGKIDGNNIATQPWVNNLPFIRRKTLSNVGNGKIVRFTFPSGASGYGRAVFVWTSKYSKSQSTGGNWNSDGIGIMANASSGTECTLIGEATGKLAASGRSGNTLDVTNNSGHSGRFDIIIFDVDITAEIIN